MYTYSWFCGYRDRIPCSPCRTWAMCLALQPSCLGCRIWIIWNSASAVTETLPNTILTFCSEVLLCVHVLGFFCWEHGDDLYGNPAEHGCSFIESAYTGCLPLLCLPGLISIRDESWARDHFDFHQLWFPVFSCCFLKLDMIWGNAGPRDVKKYFKAGG